MSDYTKGQGPTYLAEMGRGKIIGIIAGLVVVIWLLAPIYIVGPGEVGVVRQFGREVRQTSPGLNYHLPWPIQKADVVNMAQIRRAEIGFRTVAALRVMLPIE